MNVNNVIRSWLVAIWIMWVIEYNTKFFRRTAFDIIQEGNNDNIYLQPNNFLLENEDICPSNWEYDYILFCLKSWLINLETNNLQVFENINVSRLLEVYLSSQDDIFVETLFKLSEKWYLSTNDFDTQTLKLWNDVSKSNFSVTSIILFEYKEWRISEDFFSAWFVQEFFAYLVPLILDYNLNDELKSWIEKWWLDKRNFDYITFRKIFDSDKYILFDNYDSWINKVFIDSIISNGWIEPHEIDERIFNSIWLENLIQFWWETNCYTDEKFFWLIKEEKCYQNKDKINEIIRKAVYSGWIKLSNLSIELYNDVSYYYILWYEDNKLGKVADTPSNNNLKIIQKYTLLWLYGRWYEDEILDGISILEIINVLFDENNRRAFDYLTKHSIRNKLELDWIIKNLTLEQRKKIIDIYKKNNGDKSLYLSLYWSDSITILRYIVWKISSDFIENWKYPEIQTKILVENISVQQLAIYYDSWVLLYEDIIENLKEGGYKFEEFCTSDDIWDISKNFCYDAILYWNMYSVYHLPKDIIYAEFKKWNNNIIEGIIFSSYFENISDAKELVLSLDITEKIKLYWIIKKILEKEREREKYMNENWITNSNYYQDVLESSMLWNTNLKWWIWASSTGPIIMRVLSANIISEFWIKSLWSDIYDNLSIDDLVYFVEYKYLNEDETWDIIFSKLQKYNWKKEYFFILLKLMDYPVFKNQLYKFSPFVWEESIKFLLDLSRDNQEKILNSGFINRENILYFADIVEAYKIAQENQFDAWDFLSLVWPFKGKIWKKMISIMLKSAIKDQLPEIREVIKDVATDLAVDFILEQLYKKID